MQKELTASEAVYGFCGWLTTRGEITIMSSYHDSASIAELVSMFCEKNKLKSPREDWTKNLTHPD